VQAKPTPGPHAAAALARESIAAGADLIIACGGDGTINEAAEGVIGSSTPFAILPGGTANVLAHELKLGNDIERAAGLLATGDVRRVSVGRIRCAGGVDRHFLLMAGAGLDAHIVHRLNSDFKKKWGKLSYWIGGFSQLARRLEEFEVQVDGKSYQASFALFAKVRNYGGDLKIARRVTLFDDTFEVVLFDGPTALRYLKYLAGIAINRLYGMDGVTFLRTSRAALANLPGQVAHAQIDGEYAGALPGTVEIVPDALNLLVPANYGAN
jgi:diacylglycerol kinase (ATP)